MRPILKDYFRLSQAKEILQSVRGSSMSVETRAKLSVELASLILSCSYHFQTKEEKKQQRDLAKLMADPLGKIFTTAFADQIFRPKFATT